MSSEDFERLVSYNLEDLNRCYDRLRKSLRKEEKSRKKINSQAMIEDLHAEIVSLVVPPLPVEKDCSPRWNDQDDDVTDFEDYCVSRSATMESFINWRALDLYGFSKKRWTRTGKG